MMRPTPPNRSPLHRSPPHRASASRSPLAGGALIALGVIAGPAIGLFTPLGATRGFLIGLGIGVAIALAMWLVDLRK